MTKEDNDSSWSGGGGDDLASCYDFLWQTPEFILGFWAFFPVVLEVMVL